MQKNICNICGGNLIPKNGRWVCEACGNYAPEENVGEESSNLNNANQKLRMGNFDDAEELFLDIIRQHPDNVDAYWGLVLAQYGIVYERDYDGKAIPSCYNTSYKSLYDNDYFKKACELADGDKKQYFLDQAEKIEKTRKKWVEIADKEEDYDIFLSYKDSEIINGESRKTVDYSDAHDLYNALKDLGYKVFFSKVSLRGKTGEVYEPYIFNALNTAKLMIVYSSKIEYTNATWVRNEYLRYYKRILAEEKVKASLILVYKDFNPSNLSKPLKDIQNLNRNDLNFMEDLKKYIEKIMSQVKSKAPTIDRIEIKSVDVKADKSIKKINKKQLNNNNVQQEKVVIEKAKTRDLGKYSSVKFPADDEALIKVGYVCLNSSLFNDAEVNFNKVIEKPSGKQNPKAVLGKILSHEKLTNIDQLFKNDFSNFENLDLLLEIIDYSTKEDAKKYLENLINITYELIAKRNFKKAYEIYSKIADYNLDVIQKGHFKVADDTINSYEGEEDCLKILDIAFKFLQSDKTNYSNIICQLIINLIQHNRYDRAESYYYEAGKILFDDYRYILCSFCVTENEPNVNDAIFNFLTFKSDCIADKIESIDNENADKLLGYFSDVILSKIDTVFYSNNLETINKSIKTIVGYDYTKNNEFVNSLLQIILEKPCIKYDELFEFLILQKYANDRNGLVDTIITYANGYLKGANFESAKKYINFGLAYSQKNITLLKMLLLASIGAKRTQDISLKIDNLEDFELFERILATLKNEKESIEYLDQRCKNCVLFVRNQPKSSKIFEVFDKIIRYYPETCNDNLLTSLENFADVCKERSYFEEAEKYYSMIVGIDNNQYKAYWGILQSRLKCKDDEELIKQETVISDVTEFNNAIFAASKSNDQALTNYIDCKSKQMAYLEKKHEEEERERKRKEEEERIAIEKAEAEERQRIIAERNKAIQEANRKKAKKKRISIMLIIFIIAVVAALSAAITINYIIPSISYNKSINLINNGKYSTALKELQTIKKDNFKDKKKQILLCQAGLSFSEGELETGISYVKQAGGKVNVTYDSNGGSGNKGSETLSNNNIYFINDADTKSHKKIDFSAKDNTQSYINNDPVKKGYDFSYWSINSYNIKTAYNSYSCNLKLVAKYSTILYKLSYYLDDGNADNPSSYTINTPDFTLNNPIKTGYTFTKWTWSNDTKDDGMGGTSLMGEGTEITIKRGSIGNRSFMAHYTANTYKITLDWNDGKTKNQKNITYDSYYTLETPTKTGYTFSYWSYNNKKVDLSGKWNIAANATLVAVYTPISYSITYDLNGGYLNNSNPSSYNIETSTFVLNEPKKTGYTFAGWSGTEITGIKTDVKIEKGSTGDRKYVANYTANNYKVVLDWGDGKTTKTITIAYDSKYTLETPSRLGYTFSHWSYNGNTIDSKGIWSIANDVTLTAVYDVKAYKIYYDLNSGYYSGSSNPSEYTINTPTFTLNKPTKDGYTFAGWTGSDTNSNTLNVSIEQGSFGDKYFTAHYKGEISLKHSYTSATTYKTVYYNEYYTLDKPTRNGYEFNYWYYIENSKEVKVPNSGTWKLGGNITLYSSWVQEYSINYYLNDGNFSSNDDVKYKYSELTETFTLPTPTREGYEFVGWSENGTSSDAKKEVTITKGSKNNKYFYAIWIKKYNITYDLDGGTVSEANPTSFSALTESFTLNNPTKTGYTFTGWSGTQLYGYNNMVVTIDTSYYGDINFYAHYQANSYTVTLNNYSNSVTTDVVTYDSSYSLPTSTPDGKTIKYWYYESSNSTKTQIDFTGTWKIASDVSLYAVLEE